MNWFRKIPREGIENQWVWFGAWIVYEPDEDSEDPCPFYEVIYSNWRMMWGRYRGKGFGQILFKFWPHVIRWGVDNE